MDRVTRILTIGIMVCVMISLLLLALNTFLPSYPQQPRPQFVVPSVTYS